MLRLFLAASLWLPLVGAGCATAPSPPAPSAPTPAEASGLDLGLRESATAGGHVVRFAEIVEDSRCPPDVTCITQGVARIRVEIDGAPFVLTVPGGLARDTDTAEVGGLAVTVTALSPVPADAKAAQATLVVTQR